MKKFVVVIASLAALCTGGCASAPPLAPAGPATIVTPATVAVTSMFSIDFQGIIVHTEVDANSRRAVLIAGDFGRQHTPLLAVIVPADPQKRRDLIVTLRDVTGKIPRCNGDQCFVAINGVSVRIRGDRDTRPQGALTIDGSFDCLVPHLRAHPVNGGAIMPEADRVVATQRAHLPSAPAVGFVEVENGTLSASAFEVTGYFKDATFLQCIADGTAETECINRAHCRQFAAGVTWQGTTDGPARLELASNHTAWRWESIPVANEGPLMLYVENLADRGHASSEHFGMTAKLLTNKRIPEIGVGCGAPDHPPCPIGPGPAATLAVPGCTDNQWP